jgi:hypothetical protein
MAVKKGISSGIFDQRFDILDFAIDGIGRRISAVTPSSSVIGVNGEMMGQESDELRFRPG